MLPYQKQRGIINTKIRQRPLCMRDGKISVTNSLRTCRQCDRIRTEMTQMRKQIYKLNEQLQAQRTKNRQMDSLCEQISKTKQKLIWKFNTRYPSANKLKPNNTVRTIKFSQNSADNLNPKIKFAHLLWDNYL